MNIYRAINSEQGRTITGNMQYIANALAVSRQAVHKAFKNNTKVLDCDIIFMVSKKPVKSKSTRANLQCSIALLKRAILIIEEENEAMSNRNEYANIGIVEDIDRFLKSLYRIKGEEMSMSEMEEFRQDMKEQHYMDACEEHKEAYYRSQMLEDDDYRLRVLNEATGISDSLDELYRLCVHYEINFKETIDLFLEEV